MSTTKRRKRCRCCSMLHSGDGLKCDDCVAMIAQDARAFITKSKAIALDKGFEAKSASGDTTFKTMTQEHEVGIYMVTYVNGNPAQGTARNAKAANKRLKAMRETLRKAGFTIRDF